MKIKCTKEEQLDLLYVLTNSTTCVLDPEKYEKCAEYKTCKDCLLKQIDWEVKG